MRAYIWRMRPKVVLAEPLISDLDVLWVTEFGGINRASLEFCE
jgi:hypothetical protein